MSLIRIDVISAVAQMFESVLSSSMIKIAIEKNLAEVHIHDLHKYSNDKFGHIDDYPYGGGAGMLIQCEPVFKCIEQLQNQRQYDEIIFFSAEGKKVNQEFYNAQSLKKNIILICGHYKGIDQRIRDYFVTEEISIGDFVLSGGELPAMIYIDAVLRLLPGVLGDSTSALEDSYMNGLLEPPQYSRPADFRGMKVPDVLLSGNPKLIQKWQEEQSLAKTKLLRPELLD